MVNNAINIHRTNNHLSPQIIEHTHTHKIKKGHMACGVGYSDPDLRRAQKKVVRLIQQVHMEIYTNVHNVIKFWLKM